MRTNILCFGDSWTAGHTYSPEYADAGHTGRYKTWPDFMSRISSRTYYCADDFSRSFAQFVHDNETDDIKIIDHHPTEDAHRAWADKLMMFMENK